MDEESVTDEDLNDLISQELEQIDINSSEPVDESIVEEETSRDVVLPPLETKSLEVFQRRLTSQRQAFEKQLEECTQLLHSTESMNTLVLLKCLLSVIYTYMILHCFCNQ